MFRYRQTQHRQNSFKSASAESGFETWDSQAKEDGHLE